MLTHKDLQAIGEIVDSKLEKGLSDVRSDFRAELKDFRSEMKGEFRFVHAEIGRLDGKIDGAESRLGTKIDGVMRHVDGFARRQEKFDAELAAHQSALTRLGATPSGA